MFRGKARVAGIGSFIISMAFLHGPLIADEAGPELFRPQDVFELEWATQPRISHDGSRIVYVRNFMDIMTDRRRTHIWIVNHDGSDHRPLVTGDVDAGYPRWSPDGKRLAYVSREEGAVQIHVRWMDSGQTARLSNVRRTPSDLSWSPDGKWLAFTMLVPEPSPPMIEMPKKPEGAEWTPPPKVIRQVKYRADGSGFLEEGYVHLFVLPAEGGTPRQLTTGPLQPRLGCLVDPRWGGVDNLGQPSP